MYYQHDTCHRCWSASSSLCQDLNFSMRRFHHWDFSSCPSLPYPPSLINRGFLTRMVYIYQISRLRHTILGGNPQNGFRLQNKLIINVISALSRVTELLLLTMLRISFNYCHISVHVRDSSLPIKQTVKHAELCISISSSLLSLSTKCMQVFPTSQHSPFYPDAWSVFVLWRHRQTPCPACRISQC